MKKLLSVGLIIILIGVIFTGSKLSLGCPAGEKLKESLPVFETKEAPKKSISVPKSTPSHLRLPLSSTVTITAVYPQSGVNTGTVSITIFGSNFVTPCVVNLRKQGQADVTAYKVDVLAGNKLTAIFDLKGAPPGIRDIVVTSEEQSGTLTRRFSILTPIPTPFRWQKEEIMYLEEGLDKRITVGDGDNDGELEMYFSLGNRIFQLEYDKGNWIKTEVGSVPGEEDVAIAVGDGDNDGKQEIYAGSGEYTFIFRYDGTWKGESIYQGYSGAYSPDIIVGDGDSDGLSEVYMVTGYNLYQYKYSAGTWTSYKIDEGIYIHPCQVTIGDGDNDGKLEIYTTAKYPESGVYQFKYGTESWQIKKIIESGGATWKGTGIEVGDVDNDGKFELYFSWIFSNGHAIAKGYFYQAKYINGTWSTAQMTNNVEGMNAILVADGDNDGTLEIYTPGRDHYLYEFEVNAEGWQSESLGSCRHSPHWGAPIASYGMVDVGVIDLDLDGRMEVYAISDRGSLYQFKVVNTPGIHTFPTRGVGGGKVKLWGECFGNNEDVRIDVGSEQGITIAHTDGYGSFSITFTLPSQSGGTTNITATGVNSSKIAYVEFNLLPITITDFFPRSGANIGTVSISIFGGNLKSNTEVKLTGKGVPEIIASKITLKTPNNIIATFDMTSASPGWRDVVVMNPGGQPAIVSQAYLVIQPVKTAEWKKELISGGYWNMVIADGDHDGKKKIYSGGALGYALRIEYDGLNWQTTSFPAWTCVTNFIFGDGDHDGSGELYESGCWHIWQLLNPKSFAHKDTVWVDLPRQYYSSGFHYNCPTVTIADGDSDGMIELYTISYEMIESKLYLYQNRYDSGGWRITPTGLSGNWIVRGGDGDSNGTIELYQADRYSMSQIKQENGVWISKEIMPNQNFMIYDMVIGDGDNDGKSELYLGGSNAHLYQYKYDNDLWIKVDMGTATAAIKFICSGDADNDGKTEVYAGGEDCCVYQFKYDPIGSWTKTVVGTISNEVISLAIDNADDDNLLELYALTYGYGAIYKFSIPGPRIPKIVRVTPSIGTVSTVVTVIGKDFDPDEPIKIDFGKTLTMTITSTSSAGTFSATFTVDSQPYGTTSVIATGLNSKIEAIDYFTIIPVYSSIKGYIKTKDSVPIAGVEVILAGDKFATYTTKTSGYYEFIELLTGTYTVTPTLPGYVFIPSSRTYQLINSNVDNQDFIAIKGKISITPKSGTIGTLVEIQGSDFLPTENIKVEFGKTFIATFTTNSQGSFTGKFTIPPIPEGTTTLTALGIDSNLEARDYFYVKFELAYFRIEPIASPQSAGMPFNIKITAIDNIGGTLTNFNNAVFLSDTSGTILPETTTNFIAGLWQGTASITKSGTTTITVSYLGKIGTSNPFYVTPGTPTRFIVEPQNSVDVPAGGSVSITAQLMDAYGNPVGSAGITCDIAVVVISGGAGILPATMTTTNQSGQIATITYFVSTHASDKAKITLTPHPPSLIPTTSGTITTVPADLYHFTFDPIATQTAGVDFPIAVTAKDGYGNTVVSFQGTTTLSDLTNSLNPRQTSAYVAGIWTGMGSITVAGTTNITAGYENIRGTSTTFLVKGAEVASFEISPIATQTAGIGFNLIIRAKDRWGNTADGFTDTADLTLIPEGTPSLSPPLAGVGGWILIPTTTTNFTAGLWQGTVTITKAGTTAITATYQDKAGTSNSFYVSPAQLDYFKFASIITQVVAKPFQITITAYDGYGNIADYTGSAELSSNKGITPVVATPFQAGTWKGTVTIIHVGTATITATAGTKTGTSNSFVVIPSELTYLVITPATGTLTVNSTVGFTAFGYDALWNEIKLTGGRWGVTPVIGTFTNLEGPTTTFIAGTKATTGIITFATNSISGTANISILPGALHRLSIIPPAATISVTGSQPFEARGEDKHGNNVQTAVSWQVSSGLGTLTPSIGSCTVFTAGTKAMAGWLLVGSGSVQATASIRITAGTLHHINISPPSATITVTGSCSLSAMGYDEFNNEVGLTGRWELANNMGTLSETVATRTTFTAGTRVGQETLRYISGGVLGQAGITLKPLPLERFAFAPIWLSPKAGQAFTISITALDRYDNWVDEFNGLGGLTDLTKTISPTTAKFDCGVWTGSVTLRKATEATTIFIANQGKRGTSTSFQVLPGDVAGFEFGTIGTQLVRQPFGISVRALDGFGNKADYNGTVSLTDTTDSINLTAQFQHGILTATVTITISMPDVVITAGNPIATQKSESFFVLIDHITEERIGIPQEIELRLGAYFLPADFYPVIVVNPHETQINIACFYHDQCLTTKRLPGSIYRIDAFDEQENQLTDGYGTGSSALINISYDEQALASIKEDTLRVYKLENSRWLEIPDSVVDVIGNVVRARIDELGVFMLSGAITPQDLSILVVYPNPFKPSRGDEQITFEGLPANTRIRIYDISGNLIRDVENQQAVWQWDVEDNYGQQVASGIYIYIVTTEETEERLKKIGKIAVIR